MVIYEGFVLYSSKGADSSAMMSIIFGFLLPFLLLQFGFLAFVQFRLTRDQLF